MYNIFSYEYFVKDCYTAVDRKFLALFEKINREVESRGFTAKVAFVYEDESYEHNSNTACHSNLLDYPKKKSKLLYVLSFMATPHPSDEASHKQFIDWLVNKSPYEEAFVIKDPDILYKKYWVLNPHVPSNVMAGAAICTRFLTEAHNRNGFKVWEELLKLKCDLNYAFVFSHLFRPTDASGLYPIAYAPQCHHNVIEFSNKNIKLISNFCKNKKINPNKNYIQEGRYSKIEALWGSSSYGDFSEKVLNLRPKIITKHMSYNIFENAPRKSRKQGINYLSNQNDLKNVFEQFQDILEKAA